MSLPVLATSVVYKINLAKAKTPTTITAVFTCIAEEAPDILKGEVELVLVGVAAVKGDDVTVTTTVLPPPRVKRGDVAVLLPAALVNTAEATSPDTVI